MSAAPELLDTIRRVLAGQAPDYFIFPNASAFLAEGLDPEEVAAALDELQHSGELEREAIPTATISYPDGEEVIEYGEPIPGGYRLAPQNAQPAQARKPRQRRQT